MIFSNTVAGVPLIGLALAAATVAGAAPADAQSRIKPPERSQSRPAPKAPAPAAQATPAAQGAPAAQVQPAASPLAQIPGVTIQPYTVTGATIAEMRASMAAQRPADPATGQPAPSSAKWSIGTNLKRQTVGEACTVVGADVTFKADVVLPRLSNPEGVVVPEPVLAEWQRFVTSIEQQQAATLRRVYDRLPEVRQAAMTATCETASDAVNSAITEIGKPPPAPTPAPVTTQPETTQPAR